METLHTTSDYKITFNGSSTYMVIDNNNDCHFATNTERKAINYLNKLLDCLGIERI